MPTTWEIAKEKLIPEIAEGRIPDDWYPSRVRLLDPVYAAVPKQNFGNNLNALRKTLRKHKRWAALDAESLKKDRELHPIEKEGRWPDSEAEECLKIAIKEEDHLTMKPKQLYEKHKEAFKEYTLDQIRKHIDQEIRSTRDSLYWLVVKDNKKKKRQEKEAKKEAKAAMIKADPLQGKTVVELRELLRKSNLKVAGNKQELIQRIKDQIGAFGTPQV
jgi:hypothetical protein